ncbi:MAG TPA: hypothetical protein VNV82_23405 [Bryobacteraceae bacterium]|nr:hypothetical protein [Bryobacteraceae bacterium]
MVLEAEATHAQIQRIIQSKTFRSSEVHRNLLVYLAEKSLEGSADSLKEYTVGLDVFSKPASFDPRQESAVRMHVGRLRQKLVEYYRTEGAGDALIVDLPKGGFKMTFEPRPASVDRDPVARPAHRGVLALGVALALAILVASFLGFRLWRVERAPEAAAAPWTPELQQLWGPLLSSNRPLMLCLATSKESGSTGAGTASGAFQLGQFLASRKPNIMLTRSDLVSMPEVTMDNVIFLGSSTGNRQIQALSAGQPIVLEPEGIRNLIPRPGEPAFIPDSSDNDESHALISLMPGIYGHGELLYFSGNQIASVMAAVQAFTDPTLARTLVSKLTTPTGFPRYYQVVLKVKSMDNMPIEIAYMFHRDLTGDTRSLTGH